MCNPVGCIAVVRSSLHKAETPVFFFVFFVSKVGVVG